MRTRRPKHRKTTAPGPRGPGRLRAPARDESGAVAVVTALLLAALLGFVALAVDVGHLLGVRNELQNAADAGALAGARALYPSGSSKLVTTVATPDCTGARSTAGQAINASDGQSIAIDSGDIQMGHWGWPGETNYQLNHFVPLASCSSDINAIRVTTRRDASINQPVSTWFAQIFGIQTVDVSSRQATAALGYLQSTGPGTLFPIAINRTWLNNNINQSPGPQGIVFTPDGSDNGGWDAPLDQTASGSNMVNWIKNGYPENLSTTDQINLNNGNIDAAIQELSKVLASHSQSYTLSNGSTYSGWLVLLPVVSVDKFNQSASVVNFEPVIITQVNAKGNPKTINLVFYDKPLDVQGGTAGGSKSNLYAAQPKLVQ